MNRKNSRSQKKLAILPILIVGMLIATGTAYAYWYDNLTISGDVTTSNFDVELSIADYWDDEWKDVVDLGPDTVVMGEDWNKVTITLDGAYPCYKAYFVIGVVCSGKVPCHLKSDPVINAPDELEVEMFDYFTGGEPFPDDENGMPWQLHFGHEYFLLITVHVYENDDLDILPQQGQTYTFDITIPLIQYNYNYPVVG
jgi:predicted ribosomally synthesized peptide with SipW-like signal peptide